MAISGKNAVLLVKEFDVTSHFREMEVGANIEELDSTTYGPTMDKEFTSSFESGETSLGGFFAQGAGSIEEWLTEVFTSASGAVTIGPDGSTLGNRARLFRAKNTEFTITNPFGDLVGVGVNFSHGSAMGMGQWLHDRVARTATGNGVSVDNGAATTNGYQTTLHVTAMAGTSSPTLVVKVQHSTNDSTWVDLATFTTAADETSEFKSGTGTVNRHVRVIWTITGTDPSFTFAVGFARLYA